MRLAAGGAARCWGAGSYGRLGYGNTDNIGDDEEPHTAGDVPVLSAAELATGTTVVGIGLGSSHTCARLFGQPVKHRRKRPAAKARCDQKRPAPGSPEPGHAVTVLSKAVRERAAGRGVETALCLTDDTSLVRASAPLDVA